MHDFLQYHLKIERSYFIEIYIFKPTVNTMLNEEILETFSLELKTNTGVSIIPTILNITRVLPYTIREKWYG